MDQYRKRLLYRASHRGMKETDALVGGFARLNLPAMKQHDLQAFESLLDQSDNDLMSWILERKPVPETPYSGLLYQLIAYRKSF